MRTCKGPLQGAQPHSYLPYLFSHSSPELLGPTVLPPPLAPPSYPSPLHGPGGNLKQKKRQKNSHIELKGWQDKTRLCVCVGVWGFVCQSLPRPQVWDDWRAEESAGQKEGRPGGGRRELYTHDSERVTTLVLGWCAAPLPPSPHPPSRHDPAPSLSSPPTPFVRSDKLLIVPPPPPPHRPEPQVARISGQEWSFWPVHWAIGSGPRRAAWSGPASR